MNFEEPKIEIVQFDDDVWTGLVVESNPDSTDDDDSEGTTWGKFF